jgi:hypothetical protein
MSSWAAGSKQTQRPRPCGDRNHGNRGSCPRWHKKSSPFAGAAEPHKDPPRGAFGRLRCGPRAAKAASAVPLSTEEAADGIFGRRGADEYASQSNTDAIANIGFIVGGDGVLVTDLGGSIQDGARLRTAIAETTNLLRHRPDSLAPGAIWKPAPHQNIPDSV